MSTQDGTEQTARPWRPQRSNQHRVLRGIVRIAEVPWIRGSASQLFSGLRALSIFAILRR